MQLANAVFPVKQILPFFAPTGHNLYSNYVKNDTGKSPLRDLFKVM